MKNILPTTRTAVINQLIRDNHLQSYLEIGMSNPFVNYVKIQCAHKESVDPSEVMEYYSPEQAQAFRNFVTHPVTSDEFFSNNKRPFDLIFIDGDHSYEQSLKDVNNALKVIPKNGFLVLHDTCPPVYENTQFSNFEQHLPYNGEVWKTALAAIRHNQDNLIVKTFPWDWGVTVIKKLQDPIDEIPLIDLDWEADFNLHALNPEYNVSVFRNEIVSYFTSAFNTPLNYLNRTALTLLAQSNPNWEWVILDDSDNLTAADAIRDFVASLADTRVRYYRYNEQSDGMIGEAKRRATSHCRGEYLAELDHDDLLMPNLTEDILGHSRGYDFIYTNSASVAVDENNNFSRGEYYNEGFAMGYGSYRTTRALNPLTGWFCDFDECIVPPVNPKTIRHIVGIANHIRVWRRNFYNKIMMHNSDLWVADDYELVVRSFLAGGKFLHLDVLGYLQVYHGANTTDERRSVIQELVTAILATNDEAIKTEFERRGMEDWAYRVHSDLLDFKILRYWGVPNQPDVPMANDVIRLQH